jgi:regulatory protein
MKHENKDNPQKIKMAKKLSERYLRNAGEYYLNRFPASSAHFIKVMTRKIDRSCRDHPDQNRQEWIDHVANILTPYFQKLGFINDDLYSKALFNSLKNRGFSSSKIRSRMMEKSVSKDIINDLLAENGDDAQAVIIFAKKKKIGRFRIEPYNDPKDKNRDLGKLARAGFSYPLAMSIFEE